VQPDRLSPKILVYRLAGAGPLAIIVDDQHAAGRQARVEYFQFRPGALVKIGVEAQDGDPRGGVFSPGQGFLDRALDRPKIAVADTALETLANILFRCVTPVVAGAAIKLGELLLNVEVLSWLIVIGGWRGHAGERVESPDLAVEAHPVPQ